MLNAGKNKTIDGEITVLDAPSCRHGPSTDKKNQKQ
jgi:hypothetical protein